MREVSTHGVETEEDWAELAENPNVSVNRVGGGRVVSTLARRSRDAEFEPHKVQTLIRCRVA